MPPPYFMKGSWAPYTVDEVTYTFDHLQERAIVAADSMGVDRNILVTYSDHVFTRDPDVGDTAAMAFPASSRDPYGVLCRTRYRLSVDLPAIVDQLPNQRIWTLLKDDRYAHVPVVTDEGTEALYSVIFSLDPIKKNIPFDARLHIRSAYKCDIKIPDTFGDVRFSHLLMLRMKSEHPRRNMARGRKAPTL